MARGMAQKGNTMAENKTPEPDENAPWKDTEQEENPFDNDAEWNEVAAEQQIKMDKIGDLFIAKWLGMDPPMAGSGMVQGHFTDVLMDGKTPIDGNYFLNLTRDLETKLKTVPEKALVRIEWTSSINTGQKSPMRIFKVQWR